MDDYFEEGSEDEKVFMLAGDWNDIEKRKVYEDIVSLGGRYIDSIRWNSSCTHVIANNFDMTENVMGALATGRWVVTQTFIDESLENGDWVKAHDFVINYVVLQHRIRSFKRKLFSRMKVVFILEPVQSKTKEVYTRIARAGGAEVIEDVELEVLVSGNIQLGEITHVVVDPSILEGHHPMAEMFKEWMEMVEMQERCNGRIIWHIYYRFFTDKLKRPGVEGTEEKFSIFNKDAQDEAKKLREAKTSYETILRRRALEKCPAETPECSPVRCSLCLDAYDLITSTGRSFMATVCGHIFCSSCLPVCVQSSARCESCRKILRYEDMHPIFI